jgi:hypothetical protein
VPLLISIIWLGVGIRQWFVLSKWTKRYKQYKKRRDEADRKFMRVSAEVVISILTIQATTSKK